MTTAAAPNTTTRSRTLLVSFLGAVVRAQGSWVPISAAVELLAEGGLDESSVRTAVFRLKSRGWLTPERRGAARGYALTDAAMRELAAGDAIVWHSKGPAPLSAGWCIVNFTVPESARALRHQLRSRLSAIGFGPAGAALWIAPAREVDAARRVIDGLDLADRCTVFVGDYVGARDLETLVREGWDLAELDCGYREFIDEVEARARLLGEDPDAAGVFSHYLQTIDRWRTLVYRDPGLPVELVGEDRPAVPAGALFERVVEDFQGPALAYASERWPRTS